MSAGAQAAHWATRTTYGGSFTSTLNGQTADQYTWPAGTRGAMPILDQSVSTGQTLAYSLSVTYSVTLTWTLDSGDTAQSAPTPDHIWIYQSAKASARGNNGDLSVSDGLGDDKLTSVDPDGVTLAVSATDPNSHLKKLSVSNGVVTITDTESASGSHTQTASGSVLIAPFASYAVKVHAQPYNMVVQSYIPDDPGAGTMHFVYAWGSTSGNLADIPSTVTLHEKVTYAGQGTTGPGYFSPQFPPYANPSNPNQPAQVANPTILPGPDDAKVYGSTGKAADYQSPLAFVTPYSNSSYTATQYYLMNDDDTKEVDVQLRGPLSIVRNVGVRVPYTGWWYSIQKEGYTDWLQLP